MRKINMSRFAATLVMALLVAVSFSQTTPAYAQENGLVTVQSKMPFNQTVSMLKKMIAKNGMMVLSELNQGKVMAMTGLHMNDLSLFVGNPTVGHKLFAADRGVGVAVPIRVNIYEDTNGHTYVSYVKPSDQLAPFNNKKIDMIANMLDQKLGMMTGMISK